jgi:hypothetical protein
MFRDLCKFIGIAPSTWLVSSLAVNRCMARAAECNQVSLRIIARMTAKLLVMDFQVRHVAAILTPPVIAT